MPFFWKYSVQTAWGVQPDRWDNLLMTKYISTKPLEKASWRLSGWRLAGLQGLFSLFSSSVLQSSGFFRICSTFSWVSISTVGWWTGAIYLELGVPIEGVGELLYSYVASLVRERSVSLSRSAKSSMTVLAGAAKKWPPAEGSTKSKVEERSA